MAVSDLKTRLLMILLSILSAGGTLALFGSVSLFAYNSPVSEATPSMTSSQIPLLRRTF